jgi:hypothetical protein
MAISIAGLLTKLMVRRVKNLGFFPAEGRDISLFLSITNKMQPQQTSLTNTRCCMYSFELLMMDGKTA